MSSVKDSARASRVDFLPATVIEGRGDVGCPVVHFDFRVARPTTAYLEIAKLLRDGGPSYFNTLAQGFWMVTSYRAVRDMFTRRDLFSSRSFDATNPEPDFQTIPTQFDGPEHLKYRRVLSPWFSARAIYARESEIRGVARRLVAEIAPSGGGDVVSRFCLRLSTEVYLLLIGQPTQHADQIVAWLTDIFAGCAKKPGAVEPMKAAFTGLTEYYRDVLDHRRRHMRDPNTDFFTHLLAAKLDDRDLNQKELDDICYGMTTTCLDPARALRYLLMHLASHEDDRDRLNADMSLVPTAIEESLRYHPLVWSDARKAIREEHFYGCQLRKGDMVLGVIAAANRDRSRYPDPDRFVIDRSPMPSDHLSFAAGPHKCLGLHLARMEMKIGLEEWHAVIRAYVVDSAELEKRGSQLSLPLKWVPPQN